MTTDSDGGSVARHGRLFRFSGGEKRSAAFVHGCHATSRHGGSQLDPAHSVPRQTKKFLAEFLIFWKTRVSNGCSSSSARTLDTERTLSFALSLFLSAPVSGSSKESGCLVVSFSTPCPGKIEGPSRTAIQVYRTGFKDARFFPSEDFKCLSPATVNPLCLNWRFPLLKRIDI